MIFSRLKSKWTENGPKTALIWKDEYYTFDFLLRNVERFKNGYLLSIEKGAVVSLVADYSPLSIAMLIALFELDFIVVPLVPASINKKEEHYKIAQVEYEISFDYDDQIQINNLKQKSDHELLLKLKSENSAGLVLFSSGSGGKSKGIVHAIFPFLKKFELPQKSMISLAFLSFDHIGGLNTLFYSLFSLGTLVLLRDRNPIHVWLQIQNHRVNLLPTSPSFLTMSILAEAYKNLDLQDLKIISYGTEPMPQYILGRLKTLFPSVLLKQTYGLSETGILSSKSKDNDSLWVKIGGPCFETRVKDGFLEIKSESTMLGYLNYSAPFTEDGWFKTGDRVEVSGQYLKIIGRDSEIINVGGNKVFPAEIENAIFEIDSVNDVLVYGEKNPFLGMIVCARVAIGGNLAMQENKGLFIEQIKQHCHQKLEAYKVPVKVEIFDEGFSSKRFKKQRQSG